MVDITQKISTLRYAKARAVVRVSKPKTIEAVVQKKVPKGDLYEIAKSAALFAVKRTSDTIPDCHPIPIEFTDVHFHTEELQIQIDVEVKTIYKTGVEVEAMHGASVAALTAYDMLKPLDSDIEIGSIKLLEKRGGKKGYSSDLRKNLTTAVIVCSDTISEGKKEDRAGKVIIEKLKELEIPVTEYTIIPDEKDQITSKTLQLVEKNTDLIIFTGGTGMSPRDVTPEALLPLIDRNIPGISEAVRSYGQDRTPYSMLSRSVSGLIKNSLVLALPGSTNGARESMDAIFPHILHIFRVMEAARHDEF